MRALMRMNFARNVCLLTGLVMLDIAPLRVEAQAPPGQPEAVYPATGKSAGVLVFPLTYSAMNSGHVWRTTDASSDSSRSTQRGGHSDGCIRARKPTHGS